MNKIDKELNKDFQQRPAWIFVTVIIILIGASSAFSDLILDFVPNLKKYQGVIKIIFITIGFSILYTIYWKEKQTHLDPDKMSIDERANYYGKKVEWSIWRKNVFKHYPLNIIKLRIIPLFICWIIRQFINKKYKSYLFDSFDFPRYWEKYAETPEDKEKYNYEKVTSQFFKSMFRVYIKNLNQSYEIKFARDFQYIEIRWNNKAGEKFNDTKKDLYEKTFTMNDLEHLKIFTWIFPFGLYWNLRRVIKSFFQKRENKQQLKDDEYI